MTWGGFLHAAALTLLCLLALPLAADKLDKWKSELVDIDGMLKSQHFADARSKTLRLTRWMLEGLGGGPDAMYTLAVATSFRALAEAGLGNRDDAEWYWYVAVALYPKFHGSNLNVYKSAGQTVMELDRELDDWPGPSPSSEKGEIQRPVLIKRVRPKYPRGAIEQGIAQPAIVQVIIDENGIPRKPKIHDTGWEPSLAFATLEALKQWRFKPATQNGKPIPAPLQLTMSFNLKYE